MAVDIPKTYDPAELVRKWYERWEEQGYFKAHVDSSKPSYSLVMPPPNITGSLHMGHALNITLQDILTRWKRMQGYNVLWLPGTDHAGIATQNVVERQLAEEGRHRSDLGREKFEQRVWAWKETAESRIIQQIRRLGCSCDWSRKRFTFDEGLSSAVREEFVQLYEQGLIYKGEYLVNWCPRCGTAISDLEVEYEPVQGRLWQIKYPVKGDDGRFVVVATTRPETMLGDTAVAVHPQDERYLDLHGRTIMLPLMNREIPVIADSFVETEFGTGVVKVTPGHDPADFEAGRRHDLPIIKVIGEDAMMTAEAGLYSGLDRYEARRRIVRDLEKQGLVLKIEDHSHNIGHCQRCDTVIEPLVSNQWFVRVKPLAEAAIEAVEKDQTFFVPENFRRVYFDWMYNIHDWCISRQLWWGHRIPAWYCQCGAMIVAREAPQECPQCQGATLRQESDVLDTWFSSGLWPFSALGWPDNTPELKVFYPTSTLVTAFDIIFFWVARMMMLGIRFMGDVPFRTVYINGLVRDEHGQKMSKSRGNIIDPLEMIDEYGTDAIRFTLAVLAVPGTDIPFSISRMAGYRAFCNKIWNAGRFLLMNLDDERPVQAEDIDRLWNAGDLKLEARWMLGKLQTIIRDTQENLDKFRFHEASNDLYHYFWDEFCAWYIELTKSDMTGLSGKEKEVAGEMASYLMDASLRLLHPFVPFLTEELWQRLPHSGDTIMLAPYPEPREEWIDEKAIRQMEELQDFITAVRTARAENNIDPRKTISVEILSSDQAGEFLRSQSHHLANLARLEPIEFVPELGDTGFRVRGVTRLGEFSLRLDEAVDVEAERRRLTKQIENLQTEAGRSETKLRNKSFLEKAPAEVVESTRKRHAEVLDRISRLQEQVDGLS